MTKLNGVKIAIIQVTYFLHGPIFNLLFDYHIILYWKNVTYYEKFSHNLTFEGQIVWKISVFQYLMKVSKYWQIAEFPKISIEIKNRKTFYKAQTASHLRKFFSLSPPTHLSPHIPPDKVLLRLSKKNFIGRYTEI